ncbi:MAG: dihydrofolate reductase [Bacteroidetes bacterium]|nr:dihydrofolate reductase [Bacteroidota bacterium]MBU1373861.1 dihydrofolate reductase [Bacteroidota bacterium]MBU1483968.1 dihydrofolate reductase [Bacteroidota bacterium]MBU1760026.1 dihydrofolate reductase [Bacteroidota bacterium]MBU2045718.1 dihydrofolate reductase [Bacteroidota bacterium]
MTISIIVATDEENGIGKNNQLMWHLPKDLKFFKSTTSGHPVIMGRKTYDSVGKPLPNRRNIIITRQKDLKIEGVEVFNELENAIKACVDEEEVFIVGGGEIYKQALPFTDKIYLTKVHHTFNADAFFPELNYSEWKLISKEEHEPDEKHAYCFSFITFSRI